MGTFWTHRRGVERMEELSPEGSCMSKDLERRQLRYLQRLLRTQAGFADVYVLREKGSISISFGGHGDFNY